MSSRAQPGAPDDLPPVDARLVAPGTRYEILGGRLQYVPPADPPHATLHAQLCALLGAHAAPDYTVACDMLTRTSQTSDIAPDASVYPSAPDTETGGRQLEELAFEIVSTQSLNHAGRKAEELIGRGVRRVFAIHVKSRRAFEWSREVGTWQLIDPDTALEDPALEVPLPIAAVVQSARADVAIGRALLHKHNPVLEAALLERETLAEARGEQRGIALGKAQGRATGIAELLLHLLTTRFGELPEDVRARVLSASEAELRRWVERVLSAGSLDEALALGG